MMSINNQALPEPGSLRYLGIAGGSGGVPNLLQVQAEWQALDMAEAAGICTLAQGDFTLACRDPRLDAWRGFPARLRACDIRILYAPPGGESLCQVKLTIDEQEGGA